MNEKHFQNALNHMEETLIETHLQQKTALRARTVRHRRMAAVAASLAVVTATVGVVALIRGDISLGEHGTNPGQELSDVAFSTENVWIYYVAEDGTLARKQVYLTCEAQSIFSVWRTKNGLGDEVRLTGHRSEGNGQSWTYEYEGEGVAVHKPGDRYTLTLTVAGLEPYLTEGRREVLLDSLKKTMTEYTSVPYTEVNIVTE